MHEVSLAENAVELIEAAARREGFSRARVVRFEIGALACVEPDALRFAFESASLGSRAQGASIEIITVEGLGVCPACGRSAAMSTLYALCPHCESAALQPRQGTGMRIKDLEVD